MRPKTPPQPASPSPTAEKRKSENSGTSAREFHLIHHFGYLDVLYAINLMIFKPIASLYL